MLDCSSGKKRRITGSRANSNFISPARHDWLFELHVQPAAGRYAATSVMQILRRLPSLRPQLNGNMRTSSEGTAS
jgi:hypothetical protein